jgi:hypothetical protein
MSHKHLIPAVLLLIASCSLPAAAQKFFTRNGIVKFDATAPNSPETIKAINKSGTCVLDKSSGALEMAVLVKGFLFERALMQEHFNENYMESSKYPKAVFTGKLDNPAAVDTGKDGTYKVNASGTLTMHGVSKAVTVPVTFTVKGGKPSASVSFSIALADYNIAVPSVVADKVNKNVSISISADFEAMK